MDAVVVDSDSITDAEDVGGVGFSLFMNFVGLENPGGEVGWIHGVRSSSERLESRDLFGLAVVFVGLLDAAPTNFEPVGDVLGV